MNIPGMIEIHNSKSCEMFMCCFAIIRQQILDKSLKCIVPWFKFLIELHVLLVENLDVLCVSCHLVVSVGHRHRCTT